MANHFQGGLDPARSDAQYTHYYGDVVRRLFIAAGIGILLATLLDKDLRLFYLIVGVFGVLAFTVLAGLTSPTTRVAMTTNVIVSAVMFILFEFFAVDAYIRTESFIDPIFLLRQFIAVMFLFAVYFSTKTLRGSVIERR